MVRITFDKIQSGNGLDCFSMRAIVIMREGENIISKCYSDTDNNNGGMIMDKDWTEKDKLDRVFGIHDSDEIETFKAWNKDIAQETARKMGIRLGNEHWEVIDFLRIHFQNVGAKMPPVYEVSQTLDERFSEQGGLKYLFSLFPDGPLNQGSRIAGVPFFENATDPSFGSVH